MQTFKQFLTEVAGKQPAGFQDGEAFAEWVTEQNEECGILCSEKAIYDEKLDVVTVEIEGGTDEQLVTVFGKLTFTSPLACNLEIKQWAASGRLEDFADTESEGEVDVFEEKRAELEKQGVEIETDDDFFTVYADRAQLDKLRDCALLFKTKEDYLKLVEGFDKANDESVMWEDGDIDEMIHAIDLSPLIQVVEKFAI